MYLEALGQPIVVLNSLSRATDIFDKRGVTYSDRPYLPILDMYVPGHLSDAPCWTESRLQFSMEMNWSFGLMQYGMGWRKHRRPFHQLVNSNALPKFYPIFNEQIVDLLRKLNESPEQFLEHIQLSVLSRFLHTRIFYSKPNTEICVVNTASSDPRSCASHTDSTTSRRTSA